jgi:hypothetical protein
LGNFHYENIMNVLDKFLTMFPIIGGSLMAVVNVWDMVVSIMVSRKLDVDLSQKMTKWKN